MFIFTYAIVLITIAAGILYSVSLALRSFRSRRVRSVYCPRYSENDVEYELRRLKRLFPNAELRGV